jgi:uncharacterized protein YceK
MAHGVAEGAGAFQDSPLARLLVSAVCWYPLAMQRHHSASATGQRLARTFTLVTTSLVLLSLVGCGGSTEASEEGTGTETTGGETTVDPGTETDGGATLAETLDLPTTTLIPVPSSGVPRHQLSAPLRDIWSRVEAASAMVAPEFTGDRTMEAINAWVAQEFMAWATARGAASAAVAQEAGLLASGSDEYGVAGALVGYTYEEFVIAFRGAPVPDDIAADPELLQIYIDALTSASEPMARQAAAAFGACARTLAPLGPESPWVEWAQYCLYRATEVNEVYRLEE